MERYFLKWRMSFFANSRVGIVIVIAGLVLARSFLEA